MYTIVARSIEVACPALDATPDSVLYDGIPLGFDDEAAAQRLCNTLNRDACWGRDGNRTPEQVGFLYTVEQIG